MYTNHCKEKVRSRRKLDIEIVKSCIPFISRPCIGKTEIVRPIEFNNFNYYLKLVLNVNSIYNSKQMSHICTEHVKVNVLPFG